jgi:hypothetical protein
LEQHNSLDNNAEPVETQQQQSDEGEPVQPIELAETHQQQPNEREAVKPVGLDETYQQ